MIASRVVTAYLIALIIGIIFKGLLDMPMTGIVITCFVPYAMRKTGFGIFEELKND